MKSKSELEELDEELNLFDENDWDFLEVQGGESLEYFNDIRDTDFKKRSKSDALKYAFITIFCCSLLLGSGVWLYDVTVGRKILSEGDASSVNDKVVKLKRVEDGVSVDNDTYAEISKVISSYFNILNNESSYELLNNFCLTSSTFYETEKVYRDKMKYTYDSNDCYARALKCFGSYFSVSKINEILYKDDTYYVYADLSYPDNEVLAEYFYIYANDMTKFFTSNEITEQNIIKYILELSDNYDIPTSSTEICIEFYKNGDDFVFMDDSFVTSQCTSSYNYAVSQVVKILGVSKAGTQYE